jgi:hypothetical protein
MVTQTSNPLEWLQPLLLMLLIGVLLLLLLRQTMELSRMREAVRITRVLTLVACDDKVEQRPFKEGDYVGLIVGECGEGKQARIIGIYVEEVPVEKSK